METNAMTVLILRFTACLSFGNIESALSRSATLLAHSTRHSLPFLLPFGFSQIQIPLLESGPEEKSFSTWRTWFQVPSAGVQQQAARKMAPEKSVMKEKRLKKVVGEGYVKMADRHTQCNSTR
jgi:hypothetical protein